MNTQQLTQEKTEYKLLLYAILTFLGHAVMAFEQVLTYLVVNSNNFDLISAVYTQYPWTMDVGSVVMPSWLLFWASDTFRQQILKDYCPKWLKRLTRWKINSIDSTTVQILKTTKVEPLRQEKLFSA
uniref:Serpentine receptor class gamma n=1 Tax=Meloidogyne hapla TaxID=6305 RepID=A0A1I8BAH3_MELHA